MTDEIHAFRRAEPVIVVPVFGQAEAFARCLESLLRWTPPAVPILIADDASPGSEIARILEGARGGAGVGRDLRHVVRAENAGFVGNVNAAFTDAAPGDVVLVNSDVVVGPEWLERLRAAAYSDSRVATATPITNNGTICSVPYRNTGVSILPQTWSVDRAAVAIASAASHLRPGLPTAVGHCVYFRRDALDLVGGFDDAFAPGYSEEVDFSQRCLRMGLKHMLADDVVVEHTGNVSFGSDRARNLARAHHAEVERRYPAYPRLVEEAAEDREGPLAAALLSASAVLRGLSVTIDARCLSDVVTGTQVHVLQVLRGLAAVDGVHLRVLLPDSASPGVEQIASCEGRATILREADVVSDVPRSDVVHRPFQLIRNARDFQILEALGERIVVTQQDLIAYHNPAYFGTPDAWFEYRAGTAAVMALVDHVLFFSHHARNDAISAALVEEDRSSVVYIGVDHDHAGPAVEHAGQIDLPFAGDYLVCIGTDFAHKNRPFALALLRELVEAHGWDGGLVFLGPHVTQGSSAGDEADFLLRHPAFRDRVKDLAAVDDARRDAIIAGSCGVVYPTTFEGFGLVPFEAARLGVPCFFAPVTSLIETLGDELATIVPWDVNVSAAAMHAVLRDEAASRRLVDGVQEAGRRFRWADTAEGLVRAYTATIARPPRPLRGITFEAVQLRDEQEYALRCMALVEHLPADVVGPLLGISKRPALAAIAFFPLRVGKALKRAVSRSGAASTATTPDAGPDAS